jgi:hypothetical protein
MRPSFRKERGRMGHPAKFYAAHGFIQLQESMRLILPMQTIAALFSF